MTYLEQLTEERKERLKRFNAAAMKAVPKKLDPFEKKLLELERVNTALQMQLSDANRQLEAALEAARTVSTENRVSEQIPVDVPEDIPEHCPSIKQIKQIVADFYNVSVIALESHQRTWNLVIPRQIAMYLACKLTRRSLPAIGLYFDGRDHTTVLHARRKVERQREVDEELNSLLVGFETRLSRP